MRTIKFRGKRVDNGKWIYGYYVRHETRQICPIGDDKLNPEEIKHLIVVDSFADWNMPRKLQGIEVIHETVGQFTGLYDKNGIEIYEGDIVKVIYSEYEDDTVHEIKYFVDEYNYPAFDLEPSIDFADGNSFQYAKLFHNIEVIGNIHDNKDLL